MKVIIAGSRNIKTVMDLGFLNNMIDEDKISITEIISGGSGVVDRAGERYALLTNTPLVRFPADWDKYGKAAGPIRNKEMAEYADALILIWDGKSKGSANMKKCAEEKGLKIYEVIIP